MVMQKTIIKKETKMNYRTQWYLTACSLALLSGCANSQNSDVQSAVESAGSNVSTSNLTRLLEPDTALLPPQGSTDQPPLKATVYVYNSLLPKPLTPVELTDSNYFMTVHSYLHWVENQKILKIPGSAPPSVNSTHNVSKMPNSDNTNAVIMDVWGDSAKNKGSFTLKGPATFSVVDMIDADLTMSNSGNLTALALRFENAQVSINPTGQMNTHALYVDAKSVIRNGRNIAYVSGNLDQFGLTLKQLNIHKHIRFPWATEGEFMVAGQVDHLRVTPGLKLYTQGNTAKFGTLEHQGGTIELTSSAPFKTNTYFVNAQGGTLNVVWDASTSTPLMQADTVTANTPVSVTLSAVNGGVQIGDTVVLIESKHGALTSFNPLQKFAATFNLSNSTDERTQVNRLTLTLKDKNLAAAGLSHTETEIARQILSQDEATGKLRVALLDTATAHKALHDLTQGAHLSTIRSTPLSFDGLRDGDPYTHDTGISQSHSETGVDSHTTTGINITQTARFGVSLTQPSIAQQDPKSNIGGIHGQYKQFGIDGFTSLDRKLNGGSLGIYLGNVTDGYASVSMSAQNHVRHGASNTVLGHLSADGINETHVFCNVTLKKQIENLDISAQFFTEMYAARAAYSAKLNAANLSIPAEMLPLTYGVQLQTTFSCDVGYMTAGYGLIYGTSGYSPNVSLQINIQL